MTTTSKTYTVIEIETTTADEITTAINEVNMGLLASMAGLVGVWGVACMVSAIAHSDGIIQMARSYMTAIGM